MKIRLDNLFNNLGLDELDLEDPKVMKRAKEELDIMAEFERAENEGRPLREETYLKIINL